MDEIDQELKLGFLDEAEQLVLDTENCFFRLEKSGPDARVIARLFRLTHTLKGASKAAGFIHLSEFAQRIESLLTKIKVKNSKRNTQLFSLLLLCNDRIYYMVEQLKVNFEANFDNSDLLQELEETLARSLAEEQAAASKDLGEVTTQHLHIQTDHSLEKINRLMSAVDRMLILRTILGQQRASMQAEVLQKTIGQFEKISKEIEDLTLSLRKVPMEQAFQQLEKALGDSSKTLGKEVKFVFAGAAIQVDKAVLDQIWNTLVHLVGNAIFHGLESSSEERKNAGKPPIGTLFLTALQAGDKLAIEVRDDGRGLNYSAMPGWFESVRNRIYQLHGEIQIQAEKNKGTTIRLMVPQFLSIIDGIIARVGDERFVIPVTVVHESFRPGKDDVSFIAETEEVLKLRDEALPLFRLGKLLNRKVVHNVPHQSVALIIRSVSKRPFAILVDELLGQQQVVMKRLVGVGGISILEGGMNALVVDFPDLVDKYSSNTSSISNKILSGAA